MIVMMFVLFVLVTGFSFFSFSSKYNTINRAVISIPLTIFETSVPIAEESDFHFAKELMETKLKTYLDNRLLPLVETYNLDVYYYNQNDESICIQDHCDAVEINIKCRIALLCNYERTMYYEIRSAVNE